MSGLGLGQGNVPVAEREGGCIVPFGTGCAACLSNVAVRRRPADESHPAKWQRGTKRY